MGSWCCSRRKSFIRFLLRLVGKKGFSATAKKLEILVAEVFKGFLEEREDTFCFLAGVIVCELAANFPFWRRG